MFHQEISKHLEQYAIHNGQIDPTVCDYENKLYYFKSHQLITTSSIKGMAGMPVDFEINFSPRN